MDRVEQAAKRLRQRERPKQDPALFRAALRELMREREISPIPLVTTAKDVEYMLPNLGVVLAIIKEAELLL